MKISPRELRKAETRLAEENFKKERLRDVLLLANNLFKNQEITIKMIFDCLYDIGAINLLNEKIPERQRLKNILKPVAKVSKPALRLLAWRWFMGNCPELLTNWLAQQVSFPLPILQNQPQEQQNDNLIEEKNNGEIKRLRSQVRFLQGVLLGIVAVVGSSFFWVDYSLKSQPTATETWPEVAKIAEQYGR